MIFNIVQWGEEITVEKSYSDFMHEISADDLYRGLLAHGLFAEKLPPIFTSEGFFQYCEKKDKPFDGKAHRYVYYENMRNINIPRPLAIPNPFSYQLQCEMLRDNWCNLQTHFDEKTGACQYKVSRIHIRKMYDFPALFQMNYDNWRVDGDPETDLLMGKRYMVNADISTCFTSIYTHSLSWALVGKEMAKQNRNTKVWYNMIDNATRKTTHDETHGLLIGPHTSNLLSEIVLTAIDSELSGWDYVRAIDDYTCYVKTYEDGQRFLTQLGAALRKYDLSLNHKKTTIFELPLAVTERWERKLNTLQITTSYGKTDFLLTRAYFDYAIELMHEHDENAAILNYAIKTLLGKPRKGPARALTHNAKEYAAKTILGLATLYPYLVTLLDKYVFSTCCSNCPTHACIMNYANDAFQNGLSTRSFEQAAYALYFAIKYDFDITAFNVEVIMRCNDCILLLLAYLYAMHKQKHNDVKALKDFARSMKDDLEIFDQYWVFMYEILPASDLKADWKTIKKAKVTFIRDVASW